MATVQHPTFGVPAEVPDDLVGRYVAAGWVKADSADVAADSASEPEEPKVTSRGRRRKAEDAGE